jgi:hypothetical protein
MVTSIHTPQGHLHDLLYDSPRSLISTSFITGLARDFTTGIVQNLTYKNFNSDRVMRWRLYIEEYSPDLQYVKGTHNVVADALSRLAIEETPFEDNQESFLGLMECFAKKADTDEFHPLNYQQLKIAHDKDKIIQKILKMPNTMYVYKDFHGGGKKTSMICFKEKIVGKLCL